MVKYGQFVESEGQFTNLRNGDTVRLYKEAMTQAGYRPGTVALHLSVLRGTYRELGKKG